MPTTSPALRQVLAGRPSAEVRRRVEALLQKPLVLTRTKEELQMARAIEALEHLATAEARRLLQALAGGAAAHRATTEANDALARLARRADTLTEMARPGQLRSPRECRAAFDQILLGRTDKDLPLFEKMWLLRRPNLPRSHVGLPERSEVVPAATLSCQEPPERGRLHLDGSTFRAREDLPC
jgi:hypothetical protein